MMSNTAAMTALQDAVDNRIAFLDEVAGEANTDEMEDKYNALTSAVVRAAEVLVYGPNVHLGSKK